MEKIKNIEFLRIIGCIAIMLYHFFNKVHINPEFFNINLYSKLSFMTSNANKAVDLFFILSGLFFALKLNSDLSLWEFVKKKIIRFYPVLIFLILLSAFIAMFGIIGWSFYDNIMLLSGLSGTSLVLDIGKITHLSQFWYVSSMLWVFVLYFYLLKNYPRKNIDLLIVIITFFSYSLLIHAKKGSIGGAEQMFYPIFNAGMLRAFGGIGVGYLIAQWCKDNCDRIKKISLNIYQTAIVTILEFACVYFIINNLVLHRLHYKNQFIFIIVFALTIVLFIARKGVISRLLENNIFPYLAKYTYSIFMVHVLIYHILAGSIWKYHPELVFQYPVLNIICTIFIILISGILIYHFIEKLFIKYLTVGRNSK